MTQRLASIPKENAHAYALIFIIETALRELIRARLEAHAGPRWYRDRLPPDVLTTYSEGLRYEKQSRMRTFVPHHPIYYLDFPSLRKVIARRDNWKEVFSECLGRKDTLDAALTRIEPVRNSVAHNRKVSESDVRTIQSAYDRLVEALGDDQIKSLVNTCTACPDLAARLKQLRVEIADSYHLCASCQPVHEPAEWAATISQWWVDSSYLETDVDPIRDFYTKMEEYRAWDRSRGTGHKIERWVRMADLPGSHDKAQHTITSILAKWGE